MKNRKITLKYTFRLFLVIFIILNGVAFFHAYKFSHFADKATAKTGNPYNLSMLEKGKALLFGVNTSRPENNELPLQPFQTITLKSNRNIACWYIKANRSKGTVILFHGYGGQKSTMLDKSNEFIKLGYSTLLVDFMGSGGSEGNQTTIGFLEAEQVKTCFNYLKEQGESQIYLFGTSMGAVAILKAIQDFAISPKAIIIECPFGSLYETVCARFRILHVPVFPMAGLLVFWGGIQNGYWAFSHNPKEYAKSITCPTLLLYGAKDPKVSRREINEIYANLPGKKKLKIYPEAGHENYLLKYQKQWRTDIQNFLFQNS